jgi:membrane-associated protein
MNLMQIIDMILHVDKSLGLVIQQYGTLAYVFLFAIVFCETGLVLLPFLPGDSLLFIGGAFSATGAMNCWILMALLLVAAIGGNTLNYWIGGAVGHRAFTRDYRWLDKAALMRTHAFYEKHGGKTIILSRFIPVVRTFAPFVAGASDMNFSKFQLFNVTGAFVWVVGLVTGGYFFGNTPGIQEHLNTIVLVGIGAAIVPLAVGALWKFVRKRVGN